MNLLVGGLIGAENVFLACEDYKTLEFFEMHTYLVPGAQCYSEIIEGN